VNNASITLTITDSQTNFTIPNTAALSVQAGTVRISYSTSIVANADLMLSGKLEVLGGTVLIGNTSHTSSNDIEYSAIGSPQLIMSGGELHVNGQVRRGAATNSGALNYIQSGGDVIIHGKNQLATRAKLEVLNDGSVFNISGGTITIVQAGGTTFGDVQLRPETSSATGGTLFFGNNDSSPGQTFTIISSAPLWNVQVGTASVNQTASLSTYPLVMENTLEIKGNSVFKANSLAVNIRGSLINENSLAAIGLNTGGYQTGNIDQITTFDGSGSQFITGSGSNLTNFARLTIATTGTVSLSANSNLHVSSDFRLESGTLADGQNSIFVIGHVHNQATHNSSGVNGGIVFSQGYKQFMTGQGTYGNVILDNSAGVDMRDENRINGRLTMTNGVLYIDDYRLTFGSSATTSGSFGPTRMIMLNGAISDRGVRKEFPSGASSLFTFPVGVLAKYTPVEYTINSSATSGVITITPVNARHPAVIASPTTILNYYWVVDVTGLSAHSVTHTYYYHDKGTGNRDWIGTETNLRSARFSSLSWTTHVPTSSYSSASNYFRISNNGIISGDYTAFALGTEDNVTPLYSRDAVASTTWGNTNGWSTTGHDGIGCFCIPNEKNIVYIKAGHTRTLSANGAKSYELVIHGTLSDPGTYTYHNFRTVSGTGKIELTSTTNGFFLFPAGNYDPFFETPETLLNLKGIIQEHCRSSPVTFINLIRMLFSQEPD
jgi:hypothetical protein